MNIVNIILVILMFSLLILVHELGHFVLAKINNVKVEEFSFGFGSKLLKFKGKETEYNLKILPFGGAVIMNEDEDDPRCFQKKSALQRISIVAAGPIMSFVFGIVLFSIIYLNIGAFSETSLNEVQSGKPAATAGMKAGDKITEINGKRVFTTNDIIVGISSSNGNPVNIGYVSDGVKKATQITPEKTDTGYMVGIVFNSNTNPSVIDVIKHSFNESFTLISQTFDALGKLFTGKANIKTDIGGPVTIVRMSSEAAQHGILNLMYFTAFITIQLGIMNLLPFPALDGGWIIILLIELISRKKVPDKYVAMVNNIGFMALMALMIFVMIKDILFPINL